ncbi:MFS transporter [Ruegeria arenilitoris]|uniref:MFS transporter n=1 Tax=Ruegeria arenilitoris TaxID=1173585 RepID=UPI003463AD64
MKMRWLILFVLFFARTTMAFQFQSVAALSPTIIDSLAFTLVDIGLLIGLYLGPGVIIATLGGVVATWLGDRRIVLFSLVLMVAGGLIVAYSTSLTWAMIGRVISGAGGVVINVLMTKMVIDWFARHNIATAMAIFISSWPLGIALALLILPSLAEVGGLKLAWAGVSAATITALVLFSLAYRSPAGASSGGRKISLTSLPWVPLSYVAALWALYNAAFGMIIGFGTLILIERGFSAAGASSAISFNILAGTIAIPLGGWMADRTGRWDTVILASLITGVVLYPALLYVPISYIPVVLVVGGLVVGFGPGPIVSMPSLILPQHARAFGTGVFYSIYYAMMMIAPPMAGAISDHFGNVNVAFTMASVMMAAAIVAFIGFCRTATLPVDER